MALSKLLVVLGFCLGALGAAGFHAPSDPVEASRQENAEELDASISARSTETLAWPFFAGGLGLLLLGGFLSRRGDGGGAGARDGDGRAVSGSSTWPSERAVPASDPSADGGPGGAAAEGEQATARAEFLTMLEGLRDQVATLDDEKQGLSADDIRGRIDALISGPWFDLTQRNEELMQLLGFAGYARVWEGVATAERLLARCWSMATDGHLEEGLEELPHARENIARAAGEMAAL